MLWQAIGYAYDGRSRLTEISYPSALGGYTEKLGYDAAGNRIRRETELEITTYRYDNCNRLQELRREYKNAEISTAQPQIIRYTYDRQGNMLSEGDKKYSYDSFGRMVRAEVPVEHRGASNQPDEHAGFSNAAQSTGETFGIQENSSATREFQVQINRYDGEGLRHEMEENGRLIKFLYNEDREVVAEETGNGTITRYIRGLGIISSDSEEAKTYYHYVSDEQGSITHVLSEDAEILNHYSYDAFGNIIEKTEKVENRFCYNGEMLDPVTQQYYLRARFYNPVIGRFTQEDTYYGDGLNLYQYCQANPVGYVDPSGHTCEIVQNHYEQYQEYRKQHPRATAAEAYEAVTGKDPLKKDVGKSGSNPKNVFPENPDDLLPEIPRNKATKANGTTSQTIQTSDNIRIRAEQHPLLPGETYNPRHHGVHYHVEYKVDPTKSWNNKNNVKKWYPEGYTPGAGSGFIPGEPFPE